MIKGKAIYETKGAAKEYGRIGCNFYTGCPHNCEYCYLKRGAPSKQLGGTVVSLKKCFKDEHDALEVFCREVTKHEEECKKYGVFFSFTTDPLIEQTRELTLKAVLYLSRKGIRSTILTKNADFILSLLFCEFDAKVDHSLVSIGFTLTGRYDMEPNASPNVDRIAAMMNLKLFGFSTWASLEPVIDYESTTKVIGWSIKSCDHYKIGLRSGVKKSYYNNGDVYSKVLRWVDYITYHGKTVYLKQSVLNRLAWCPITNAQYDRIITKTVDAYGNPIKTCKP